MPVFRIVQGLGTTRVYSPRGDPGLQGWLLQGWLSVRVLSGPGLKFCVRHRLQPTQDGLIFHSPCSEARTGRRGFQELGTAAPRPLGHSGEIPVSSRLSIQAHLQAFHAGPRLKGRLAGSLCRGQAEGGDATEVACKLKQLFQAIRWFIEAGILQEFANAMVGHEAAFSIRNQRSRNAIQL